jgi:hypothetical protein
MRKTMGFNSPRPTARRSDWTNKPMSAKRTHLPVELHYGPEEMEAIRLGFIPDVMEDKWFIIFENQLLYCFRSWTGYEIYRAHFLALENDYVVREIVACRDPELYKNMDEDYDIGQFQFLIDRLLLGDTSALDRWHPGGEDPLGALKIWSAVGRAMMPPDPGSSAGQTPSAQPNLPPGFTS